MSQRLVLACDYQGCEVRIEVIEGANPDAIMRTHESAIGWMCLREPSMMNRSIDICPEHAKLLGRQKKAA